MALALSCSQKLTTASGPLWPRSSKSPVFFALRRVFMMPSSLLFGKWDLTSERALLFSRAMSSKEPKLSSLSGLEKQLYGSFLRLKESISIVCEESEEKQGPLDGYEQQVDLMISLLGSKLEGRQV